MFLYNWEGNHLEFQLTLHKSALNAVRLVSCITALRIKIFLIFFILQFFDEKFRDVNTGKWSDTSLLMNPFLSFNKVSKMKFMNILSVKYNVLDVSLVGLAIKGM